MNRRALAEIERAGLKRDEVRRAGGGVEPPVLVDVQLAVLVAVLEGVGIAAVLHLYDVREVGDRQASATVRVRDAVKAVVLHFFHVATDFVFLDFPNRDFYCRLVWRRKRGRKGQ